jgi:FkbM family methyltransferase
LRVLTQQYGLETREGTTDWNTLRDVFINQPYGYDVPFEPDVIIEVGANVGFASIYFARRFPSARVLAIEAEAENYAVLERHVSSFERIQPIHAAVSAEDGETSVQTGDGEWGFYISDEGDTGQQIETLSIPTLRERYDVPDTADVLMKVNIAGFESTLFAPDSVRWLRGLRMYTLKVPSVMGEACRRALFEALCHPELPPTSLDVYKGSLVFRRED